MRTVCVLKLKSIVITQLIWCGLTISLHGFAGNAHWSEFISNDRNRSRNRCRIGHKLTRIDAQPLNPDPIIGERVAPLRCDF